MEKAVIFGERVFLVKWENKDNWEMFERLYEQMLAFEDKLNSLMEQCEIPEEIILNFKKGNDGLYGQYFVQDEDVSKKIIVIDIYTKRWLKDKNRVSNIEVGILDTFVHELLHNKYKEEKITRKKAREFLAKI